MMGLDVRELRYAMSANSLTSSSHRIAIVFSDESRFIVCRDCHLSFDFPAEARYDTIAEKFESHSCSVQIRSNCDAPVEGTRHG